MVENGQSERAVGGTWLPLSGALSTTAVVLNSFELMSGLFATISWV